MTIEDVAIACEAAGFEGDDLVRMVAIGIVESGCRAEATNDTRRFRVQVEDGRWQDPDTGELLPFGHWPEYSVGWAQLNIDYHRWITEAQARDYLDAAVIAKHFRNQRGNFDDWSGNRAVTGEHLAMAAHAIQRLRDVPPPAPPEPAAYYLPADLARSLLVTLATIADAANDVYLVRGPDAGAVTAAFVLPYDELREAWPRVAELPI